VRTEGVYFAPSTAGTTADHITASHNPPDYNGMKIRARAIEADQRRHGLQAIRAFADRGDFPAPPRAGVRHHIDTTTLRGPPPDLCRCTDAQAAKIVVNARQCGAG